MDDALSTLNSAQRSAVTSQAPVLQVLAGPGSGKTKTLSARVAYLIANHGYQPWNIIVCTFTNKAAKEMKERIGSVSGHDVANRLILGTFHSIARKYLSNFGSSIHLDEKFGIADTSDTKSIINRIIKNRKLTNDPQRAQNRISTLKSRGLSAQQYVSNYQKTTRKNVEDEHFSIVYAEYEEELKLANLLDFDDLLLRCVELLHHNPQCVARIQAVLIDEFQDTNEIQYRLMRLFSQAANRITIVGDPDQSIYGWRNAKIENLELMRQQYPNNQTINLEENYRSSGAILFAAELVIQQDTSRPQKSLKPTRSLGKSPVLRELLSPRAEAAWLVSEVQRTACLTGGLLRWNDYAVLLRSAFLSRNIEHMLGKAGIPYRTIGGHRFYDRVEVKLVLDYLRVIDRLDHTEALARIINIPARKIGDSTVHYLLRETSERKLPLWSLILEITRGEVNCKGISLQAQKGLGELVNLILVARKRLERDSRESLAGFLNYLVDRARLKPHLQTKYPNEFEARWENIEELIIQATEASALAEEETFFSGDDHDLNESDKLSEPLITERRELLRRFLANVSLTTDIQQKSSDKDDQNYLTLSTMHAAKGLEWPVVFIPSAYEGSIPHSRAEDTDEERRLLYVAMTRAQALLYLSYPVQSSDRSDLALSPFIADKKAMARLVARGGNVSFDDVQELARILNRQCPRRDAIQAGRQSLEHLEDDQRDRFGIKLEYNLNSSFESDKDISANSDSWLNAISPANPTINSFKSGEKFSAKRGSNFSIQGPCNPRLLTSKLLEERSAQSDNGLQSRSSDNTGYKAKNRMPLSQISTSSTVAQRNGFSESKALFTSSFMTAKRFHQASKENFQPQRSTVKRSIDSDGASNSVSKRKKSSTPVEGRGSLNNWLTKP